MLSKSIVVLSTIVATTFTAISATGLQTPDVRTWPDIARCGPEGATFDVSNSQLKFAYANHPHEIKEGTDIWTGETSVSGVWAKYKIDNSDVDGLVYTWQGAYQIVSQTTLHNYSVDRKANLWVAPGWKSTNLQGHPKRTQLDDQSKATMRKKCIDTSEVMTSN